MRFEPDRLELSAVHSMRLRPLAVSGTLRLRLDDDFRVSSVSSGDGASLLFFRVRDQDSIVVSLGTLAERGQPFTLVTRYAGRHDPAPVDQELVQVAPITEVSEDSFIEPPPTVYSNRTSWYPRPANEDFAPARLTFDTPGGLARRHGRRAALAAHRGAAHAHRVPAGAARQVPDGRRRTAERPGPARRRAGSRVRGYGTPRTRSDTAALVPRAQEILAFYCGLFGPCPYPAIGLVLVDAETPGGHSPPGLVYLQRRPPVLRGRLADDPANFSDLPDFFLAHELAHQWWGQGTAPGELPRALAVRGLRAVRRRAVGAASAQGEGAFRGMMDRMARWAMRHDDAGPIVLGQRLGGIDGDPRVFRAVVYDKGAWVIHMLRGVVGDTAFFAGARAFLQEHRFAKAVADDLRRSLEQASGRDLGAYFERWIDDTGLPVRALELAQRAGRRGLRHDRRGEARGAARAGAGRDQRVERRGPRDAASRARPGRRLVHGRDAHARPSGSRSTTTAGCSPASSAPHACRSPLSGSRPCRPCSSSSAMRAWTSASFCFASSWVDCLRARPAVYRLLVSLRSAWMRSISSLYCCSCLRASSSLARQSSCRLLPLLLGLGLDLGLGLGLVLGRGLAVGLGRGVAGHGVGGHGVGRSRRRGRGREVRLGDDLRRLAGAAFRFSLSWAAASPRPWADAAEASSSAAAARAAAWKNRIVTSLELHSDYRSARG